MGLRVNQNIAAMNAYRNLSVTDSQMSKSLEKLSSGFRINHASDDAAGLSVSESLRSQVGGIRVAVRNAQDGISVVQTAEGALSEVHNMLQRMRDLAVQASNSGSQDTDARAAAQTEVVQLKAEIDRIGQTTAFGGQKLLDGTYGSRAANVAGTGTPTTDLVVAAGTADQFKLTVDGTTSSDLTIAAGTYNTDASGAAKLQSALQAAIDNNASTKGLVTAQVRYDDLTDENFVTFSRSSTATGTSLAFAAGTNDATADLGLTTPTNNGLTVNGGQFQIGANAPETLTVSIDQVDSTTLGVGSIDLSSAANAAITQIDDAIKTVSTQRANLGAFQNRFEHTINNLNVAAENLSSSESRIRDTDMAQEMVSFTRSQILTQAGTAMLAQANQAPQSVLSLLRG
jgi:flagellin